MNRMRPNKTGLRDPQLFYKIKKSILEKIFRPYATVLFCYSPWVGAWFALLSWGSPRTASAGLFSLLCTWVWGKALTIKPPGELHLVNGLLCGLFLSAYYTLDAHLLIGLAIITLFITISVNWLCHYMWYMGRVPLMTFPFVIGSWLLILVFQVTNISMLPPTLFVPANLPDILSWVWSNDFFSALGGLMLIPYPLPGALMFLGLFIASRYLAFLAVAGYIVGVLVLNFLDRHFLGVQTGYNFILVALALGGIFMVPSITSFFIALGGSILAALFSVSLYGVLDHFKLPLLIMPFLLSTYFWLGGLGSRIDKGKGILNVDFPVSPEIAWENNRLSNARGINIESTPMMKLFEGEWFIELDAMMKKLFYRKKVVTPDQDEPIFSPIDALILSSRDGSEILHHESLSLVLNKGWGNFLLLRDRLGQYVFFPRLKNESIKLNPGQWVTRGQPIADCGKSSDDSSYNLYIQVQKGVLPTSDPIPYHLVNILNYRENQPKQFNIFYLPLEGDFVLHPSKDAGLSKALLLPPGLKLNYLVTDNRGRQFAADLQTGMTPVGQPRLYAARDRSVGYEESDLSLVLYDRQGKTDTLLDIWTLAIGLSPLTNQAEVWHDKPALYLWPLNLAQRTFLAFIRPLGVGCDSQYSRTWDESSKTWIQNGIHRAYIMPGVHWEAKTSAIIDEELGVKHLQFEMSGEVWQATLKT